MKKLYINDNGEYYNGRSVIYDGNLYISPTEEIILLAGYHLVEEDPVEVARREKLRDIRIYDSSASVNEFYLVGQPMWLDAKTRQTLRISIESYRDMGYEQVTKWFGGQRFTFPTNAWIEMLNALEVYAAEALNVTEQHRAEVSALDNVEDIEAYDITAGYPEKLNLTVEWLRSR